MNLVPNPEYEKAELQGVVMNGMGIKLSDEISALAFGRTKPPRYNRTPSGGLVEIPAFLPEKREWNDFP